MIRKRLLAGIACGCLLAISALAQDTPSDISDLVGARGAGGETQLRNRGYSLVKTQPSDDRVYTTWWNSRTNTCIQVATVNGRYDSITKTLAADCNRSERSGRNDSGSYNSGRYNNYGGYDNNSGYFGGYNRQEAVDECQNEARHRLLADFGSGGGRVDLSFDRSPSTGSAGWNKTSVKGSGRFAPGGGARSRPFKYTCSYNGQSHQVSTLNYEFVDGNNNDYNNQPSWNDYRPSPSYNNSGRIWVSGPIVNRGSNKALDVASRSNSDRANVQQWSFADQANQKWDVIDLGGGQYSIINQQSNKALDVAGDSERDGGNVQQYRWNGGDNQRWYLRKRSGGYYEIINVHSGKCLDVSDQSTQDGANIQQWSCSGANNQAWKFGR